MEAGTEGEAVIVDTDEYGEHIALIIRNAVEGKPIVANCNLYYLKDRHGNRMGIKFRPDVEGAVVFFNHFEEEP